MALKGNNVGQTGFFVVLGAVFVMIALFGTFLIADETILGGTSDPTLTRPVTEFVEACLQQASDDALKKLLLQGGHYESVQPSRRTLDVVVPYYWQNNQGHLPSLEHMQQQHELLTQDTLPQCLQDFESLRSIGLEVTAKNTPNIVTRFAATNNKHDLNLRLTVNTQDGKSASVDSFTATTKLPVIQLHSELKKFMQAQAQSPQSIPIGDLLQSAQESPFEFQYHYVTDDTILYAFLPDDQPEYVLSFLAEYDWSNQNNQQFSIDPIPVLIINESKIVQLQVTTSANNPRFSDDSDLFDINPLTGLITFDPDSLENGEYTAQIQVTNDNDQEETELFKFIINFEEAEIDLPSIGEVNATVGVPFEYRVKAFGTATTPVLYSDNTRLFDIDPIEGTIEFTPEEPGRQVILITAAIPGAEEHTIMELTIT